MGSTQRTYMPVNLLDIFVLRLIESNVVNSLVRCTWNVSARPLKQSAGLVQKEAARQVSAQRARSLNSVRTPQIRPSLHGEVLRRTYSKGTEQVMNDGRVMTVILD